MKFRKAVETENVNTKSVKFIDKNLDDDSKKSLNRGVAGTKRQEAAVNFISTPSEKVFSNENGSFIVLGKDRPSSRFSGYGGLGDTSCASIDLVAGRLGPFKKEKNENEEDLWVDPSFTLDAARVYVSQKTDVDENFKLAKGSIGNYEARSAVALKADGIRIIGREGIKIVTGVDGFNSQGGLMKSIAGIDLIAGNNDKDLQPMVKGENLVECVGKLIDYIEKLNGIVCGFLNSQMQFNAKLASHVHPILPIPVVDKLTVPTVTVLSIPVATMGAKTTATQITNTAKSLQTQRINFAACKNNYLEPYGGRYINSRHNNTN